MYTKWQEGKILAVNAFLAFFAFIWIYLHYFALRFFTKKHLFFPALLSGTRRRLKHVIDVALLALTFPPHSRPLGFPEVPCSPFLRGMAA